MKKFWLILITITLVLALCGVLFACGDNSDPTGEGDGEKTEISDTLPQFDGEKTDLGKDDVKEQIRDMILDGLEVPGIVEPGDGEALTQEEALEQLEQLFAATESVQAFRAADVTDEKYNAYKKSCEDAGMTYAGEYNVEGTIYTAYMGKSSMTFIIRKGTEMIAATVAMKPDEQVVYEMPADEVWARFGLSGMKQPANSRIIGVEEGKNGAYLSVEFEFDSASKPSFDSVVAFCKGKGFTLAEDSRHESDDGYERDIWRCSTIIDEEVFECDVDYVAATDMTASRSWWTLYIRVANTTAENETSFADGYESATYFVKYERTYNDLYEDKDGNKQEGEVVYTGVEVVTMGQAGAAYGDVFSSDELSYDSIAPTQWKLDYETYLWLFDKSTRDNYTVDRMRKRLGERRELDVVSDYTVTRLDYAQANYMGSRNRVKTGETKTIAGFECEKYTADVHVNGDGEEDIVWTAEFWIDKATGLVLEYSGRDRWDDPSSTLRCSLVSVEEGDHVGELLALPLVGQLQTEMPVDEMKDAFGLDEMPFDGIDGAEGWYVDVEQPEDGVYADRFYVYGVDDDEFAAFGEKLAADGWREYGYGEWVYDDGGVNGAKYNQYRVFVSEQGTGTIEDRYDGREVTISVTQKSLPVFIYATQPLVVRMDVEDIFDENITHKYTVQADEEFIVVIRDEDPTIYRRAEGGLLVETDADGMPNPDAVAITPAEFCSFYDEVLEWMTPSHYGSFDDVNEEGGPLWTGEGSDVVAGRDVVKLRNGYVTLWYDEELDLVLKREYSEGGQGAEVTYYGEPGQAFPGDRPQLETDAFVWGMDTAIANDAIAWEAPEGYAEANFDDITYLTDQNVSTEAIEAYRAAIEEYADAVSVSESEGAWNAVYATGKYVVRIGAAYYDVEDMEEYGDVWSVKIFEYALKTSAEDFFGIEWGAQTASVAQKLGEGKYGYTQSVSGEGGEEEKPSGDMPTIDFDKNGNMVSVNGELYVFGGQSAKVYSGLADFAGLQFVYSVGEYAGTAESVVDNSLPAALSIVFDTSKLTKAGAEDVNGVACDKYTGTVKFRGIEREYAIWVSDGVTYRYEGLVIGGDFGSAETVICELKFEDADVMLTAPAGDEELIVTGGEKTAAEWDDRLWLNGATLKGFKSYNIDYVTDTAMRISFTFDGETRPSWSYNGQTGEIDGADDAFALAGMTQSFWASEIWNEPEIVVDEDGSEVIVGDKKVIGWTVTMLFELDGQTP